MPENAQSHLEGRSERVDLGGMVDALKVLAHPVRLRILQWLRDPRAEFPIEQGIADPDEYGVCIKQITDVDEIGAHGVPGQVPLQGQVAAVGGEQISTRPRHGRPP